jgi:hypothetical protein
MWVNCQGSMPLCLAPFALVSIMYADGYVWFGAPAHGPNWAKVAAYRLED